MSGVHQQQSEVSHLLAQIHDEYEAAERGLSDLSCGTSRHTFITARLERMGQLHKELHELVGDAAIASICGGTGSSPVGGTKGVLE